MRGLIIRAPWIDLILQGKKTWEIRSKPTTVRERIALIRGGSGTVVGTAELADCRGPFAFDELAKHRRKHKIPDDVLTEFKNKYRDRGYAWVLAEACALHSPIHYQHPAGAVIWVTLPDNILTTRGPVDYQSYILSAKWDRKRRDAIEAAGWRCERCGANEPLQVHHLHYDTLGHEGPGDLEALCESCHSAADDERRSEAEDERFERRFEGWADRVFGPGWHSRHDQDDLRSRFRNWLEEIGDA